MPIPKLAKRIERIHAVRSHGVSVLDSLTNETSVYLSIREAARARGGGNSSINTAFKRLTEGESTVFFISDIRSLKEQ
jgi:fatty acid-binding protein DegV